MSDRDTATGRRGGSESRPLSQVAPATDRRAERAVLGGLLVRGSPRSVSQLLANGLLAEHFFWESHVAVFSAAVSLSERRAGIDHLTVYAEMEKLGRTGGLSLREVDELAADVPDSANIAEYAARVKEMAAWRERRRKSYEMVEAAERLDAAAWEQTVAVFGPTLPPTNGSRTLRLVDEDGQVVSEERHCDDCRKLQDQLDGAQKEIAGWRTRCANLQRDKERDARKNPWWLPAQRLFEYWKKQTGHKNSKWTADRFYAAEPLLRRFGPEVFERAITGIAHDPYTKLRRNGSVQRYDSWATLCKGADAFEEYACRAPKGWKSTLTIPVAEEEEERTDVPRLVAVEAS